MKNLYSTQATYRAEKKGNLLTNTLLVLSFFLFVSLCQVGPVAEFQASNDTVEYTNVDAAKHQEEMISTNVNPK